MVIEVGTLTLNICTGQDFEAVPKLHGMGSKLCEIQLLLCQSLVDGLSFLGSDNAVPINTPATPSKAPSDSPVECM